LGVTESTLQQVEEIVRAAMALANQMATGTYNAQERQAAARQVQGFIDAAIQMGNTRFRENYLLSGYRIDTVPFTPDPWEIQPPALKLQPGSTGSATSGGAFTGTVSRTYVVEVVSGGGPGVGTYRVTQDGGQTWTAPAVIPVGPAAIGGEGVEVTFSGAWVAGDRFSVAVSQPIRYRGDEHTLEIGVGLNSRLAVSEVGGRVLGGQGGSADLFRILANLKSSLEANDPGEVGRALDNLRTYQGQLTSTLAGLGAGLDQVATKNVVFDNLKIQLVTALSNKGDTDLVAAVNTLKSLEVAYQGALLASTKVMSTSLLDYLD
jgi:flagellin-like hook-associated protein FlgL